MLKTIAVDCLKYNFPQINRKTQIVKTDLVSIEITEKVLPERKHVKRETYFSTLFKALLNRKIESDVVPHDKENIIILPLEQFNFGYRHVRENLIVCYDNVSDTLYVNKYGYTDIDLSLLK